MTMLRQPEQRVLSAWYDSKWDHGANRFGNVCHGTLVRGGMVLLFF